MLGPQYPATIPAGAVIAPPQPAASLQQTRQSTPRAVIRAQMGEENERRSRPALVTLPSPEQLGVSKPRPRDAGPDWTDARRRLDALGATTFQVVNLSERRCRFICLLPTNQNNYNHRIESEAGTEAEAVRLGLERAEAWSRQR